MVPEGPWCPGTHGDGSYIKLYSKSCLGITKEAMWVIGHYEGSYVWVFGVNYVIQNNSYVQVFLPLTLLRDLRQTSNALPEHDWAVQEVISHCRFCRAMPGNSACY